MKKLILSVISGSLFLISCSNDPLKLEVEKISSPCDFYEVILSIHENRIENLKKGLALIADGKDTSSIEIKTIATQNELLTKKYDEIKKALKRKTQKKVDDIDFALKVKNDCPEKVDIAPKKNDEVRGIEYNFITALNFKEPYEYFNWVERNTPN